MKVFVALLLVGSLSAVVQGVTDGSEYFGGFLCPLPSHESQDTDFDCSSTCSGAGDCNGDSMLCCRRSPDCRTCTAGMPIDGVRCMTDDGEVVEPLTLTLDEEECEVRVCLSGMFYYHKLEDDNECTSLPQPVAGDAMCGYKNLDIPPAEITVVEDGDDCEICVCASGILFCRDCPEPKCVYDGEELEVGDSVSTDDGCNECICEEGGTLACTERECGCEDGEEIFYCFQSPCEGARCPAFQNATCFDNYCGGCKTRWVLDGEDVTQRCIGEPPSAFELSLNPTCPAVEVDTCSEDCSDEDPCPDTQLCCRGCGSSCRDPINLPSYSVPLACPPQIVTLSEDSDACDLECQSNDQCPGEKICCRSGCSSSCQNGLNPPEPCSLVRRILEEGIGESSELLGQFVPGCSERGFFSPVQTWENNRWCVNVVTGEPIGDAYTDGLNFMCPNCTVNGRVFYAGQSFNDDCNTCKCTETGAAACTEIACLDPCDLPVSPGMCEDREAQYFFQTETRTCEKFYYTGCGGNANRFSSVYNCLHACVPESVCLSDWDEGEPCNDEDEANPAQDLYYYYDTEEGQCTTAVGYRCGGNSNRFQSGIDCLHNCDPSNPGPTDADGNSCWEVQCGIPFCGEGVQPVNSEDSCCPVCPLCEEDEFQCRDGSCVPARRVCDGLRDCGDGSDERDDGCDPTFIDCEFQCSEEECVPENYVCDGVLDCTNALDEHNCEDHFESGVPFYPPPHECPDSSDIIGACDVSDCSADIECEEGKMCCLNNCNQRFCTEPRPVDSPPCRAIVDRLSANISYIPQCDNDGYYQPIQCSGEGENRMCWCVNVFSGVPFSRTTSNRDSLDCHKCENSSYAPGERYDAEDGCNTCVCTASGESVCTRRACVEESCDIDRSISLDHGETKELDCLTCTCLYGQLNCSRRDCLGVDVVRQTIQVEMTFDGELPTTEEEVEELERDVERSLLQMYGMSMGLDEDQMEIVELRSGSVVVVVVFKDPEDEDETGANVTLLVYQVEEDYEDGVLVIRHGDKALVPSGEINVEMVSQEEEDDKDDYEFVWWHGLVIGVTGAVLVVTVFIVAIMMIACLKRRGSRSHVKVDPNPYTGTVEMRKVPLDEKA